MMRVARSPRRGFSLIEVMVVVAMLGVLAALAAPNLLFEAKKAQLTGTAEELAAFIMRAQTEAMTAKRCVRVTFPNAKTAVAERLNVFDCDNAPLTAPHIDGTAIGATGLWLPIARMNVAHGAISLLYDNTAGQVCSDCASTLPGGTGVDEIRFRPNGRIFTVDNDFTDDDAIVVVRSNQMPGVGTGNQQKVLVDGNGLLCVLARGVEPAGTAPNFSCP